MSLISDCETLSLRQEYLDSLVSKLGRERVHQYGKCGDGHVLPYNHGTDHMRDVMEKYEFFLAFF
jgi:hypothetical protein